MARYDVCIDIAGTFTDCVASDGTRTEIVKAPPPGAEAAGPALIDSTPTTVPLLAGQRARVDGRGNLLVESE